MVRIGANHSLCYGGVIDSTVSRNWGPVFDKLACHRGSSISMKRLSWQPFVGDLAEIQPDRKKSPKTLT